jgi:hypothetical protein
VTALRETSREVYDYTQFVAQVNRDVVQTPRRNAGPEVAMANYYTVDMWASWKYHRFYYHEKSHRVEQSGGTKIGSASTLKSALALMESKVPGKVTETKIKEPS